ncbi:MAG: 4Fe-4S double cluster binding domain-containing protein [Candidatus Aminicenantales bacterium]
MTLEIRLREWAAARGYGLAVADIGVVETVRQKLEERRASGMINAGFFEENLNSFQYLDGVAVRVPVSAVMVAVPSPIHILPVEAGGLAIDALIPPTYVRYRATFENVLADMKANALPENVAAELLKAPLKSLAVHMGLVVYGRNNITYRPGLGSGHQLCGYAVGMEPAVIEGSAKGQPSEAVLERCRDCRACLKACPTAAIREDRFLISAERCFTLHSESRRPLPAWVRPPKSTCLIGCMDCQLVCPENKDRLMTAPAGVSLTADETEEVIEAGRRLTENLGGEGSGSDLQGSMAWRSARAKVESLGMSEDIECMGRNLDFLIRRRRSSRRP